MHKKIWWITIVVLLIDQLSKILIEMNIVLNRNVVIIKDFFYISNVNNYGAAWSLFNNQIYFLIGVTIICLFVIQRYMNTFKENRRNITAFGLLIGGVTGNLIDRVFLGYVRDFLSFKIFGYDFPVFNISDIAIFLGVGLLILAIIKGEDNEDRSERKSREN